MKRLLRISFNQAIFSFIPILSWMMLGLLLDKNLANVFTLTYPLQFIWQIFRSMFATGANISKEKDKKENAVLSGMTLGIIIGFVVFGFIAINIKNYIKFMNMDYNIYKEFALYSVIQLYIQLIFSFVMEKLYFEGKEKLANKYMLILNILNFGVLMGTSLITKDKTVIVTTTLITIFIYTLFITIKQYKKFKFKVNLLQYIKYESVSIARDIFFFLTYLFGFSNALEFGAEYITALNFAALVTDTQWDSFGAVDTVAKIDISKGKFNYKEHKKNAYKLLGILLSTTFLMLIFSYRYYELNLTITLMYLSVEIVNFLLEPLYEIKTCYLQLVGKFETKVTSNKIAASGIRVITSFLKTPFCTAIGQSLSMIEQFIVINIMFYKHFKIDKEGKVIKIGGNNVIQNYR